MGRPKKIKPIEQPIVPPVVDQTVNVMDGINDKVMDNLLIELMDTRYWLAIKKYIDGRLSSISNSLNCVDPFKDPTQMARVQGQRMGLMDLPLYVEITRNLKIKELINKDINP